MNRNEYSLSEISRLVETNDAHIINVYITSSKRTKELHVTIKVNTSELEAIIATFNRFEYEVRASYQETDHIDVMKERYDSLMNYLKI